MANALFIGWGAPVPGKEAQSLQVFGEAQAHFQQFVQNGDVESAEYYALAPHGGGLTGFLVARGDPEKLARLQIDLDFIRLTNRAQIVVQDFGVVFASTGDEMQGLFEQFGQNIQELG